MRTLACLLTLVAVVAANPITDRGKKAITRAYEEHKLQLKKALEDAHPSVLVNPLKQLRELEEAGIANQDYIIVFGSGEAVDDQLSFSATFWANKMTEVTRPYVNDPEKYMYLIIDIFPIPPDPTWNMIPEFKETESHINGLMFNAMDQMNQTYTKQLEKIKAKEVKDATASAWCHLQMARLLRDTETSMEFNNQYAKRDAANGDYSAALERAKKAIRDRKNHFDKEVQIIYKAYLDATDN